MHLVLCSSPNIYANKQMKRKTYGDSQLQQLITKVQNKSITVRGRKNGIICEKLRALDEMIGLAELKDFVCDLFYFYAADLPCEEQFRNISITGRPGCGKTEVCVRIASLLQYIMFNCTKEVSVLTRADLIGQVLGETAIKTIQALEEHHNQCVFIDEVYSLGNTSSDKDIFSKECIDTICAYLSENMDSMCMIIAGYSEATDGCFFGMNEGLRRRFPFSFTLRGYTADELLAICKLKLQRFSVHGEGTILEYIRTQKQRDTDYGAGEIVTFINRLLLSHSAFVCHKQSKPSEISLACVKKTIEAMSTAPDVVIHSMYT